MNAAIEDIYPLTPMQQGMLFHTLMAPGTGVYVEQLTCRIGRGLDVARFEQALQALVDRHAILRSVFAWDKLNEPLQIARRELRVPLAQLDWRERPAGEREAAYDAFLAEDYQRGFALDQPPLLRFTLIRFGDEDARFVWTSHHILYDGWSFAQLMSEFLAIYVALSRGEASALPPVRPYRDYIAWLKQRDLAKAEAFWRDSLAGFAHPTPLGVDRRREDRAGVEQIIWRYEEAGTARLRDWTRRAGITMNTLVQGVWAILLGRYSRQATWCSAPPCRGARPRSRASTRWWACSSTACRCARASTARPCSATGCARCRRTTRRCATTNTRRSRRSANGARCPPACRCSPACWCSRTTRSTPRCARPTRSCRSARCGCASRTTTR